MTLKRLGSPVLWFALTLVAIALFTSIGPAEKSLGTNARVVYLHGAWVWAALVALGAAAASGLLGLLAQKDTWHTWSQALGRTGMFFWITYLPISLWAMQTNWNGLFLSEPRWRLAMVFSITGLLMQIGLTLIHRPIWTSTVNLLFFSTLVYVLQTTDQVMHPPSPIMTSDAWRIQLYFVGLITLTLLAAWQLARWWRSLDPVWAKD